MRPIIPDELADAIHEKIIIDLCIHAMEARIVKAESDQNSELMGYFEDKLKKLLSMRKKINSYLKNENTKIHEVVICDDMFVEYPYYIKTKEGHYFLGIGKLL